MACLVKRSNSEVKSVLLSDGKTASKTYLKILNEVKNGVPTDFALVVSQSLSPFVGKFINNISDPKEIALGLYTNLYSKDFKSWYGDWTQTGEEPEVKTVNGMKVFQNARGEVRSIYNTGRVKQNKVEYYRSVATKKTQPLIDYVSKTIKVLNLRIKEARQLRDKVNNNPKLTFEEKTKQSKKFEDIISDAIEKKKQLKEQNSIEYVYLIAETDLDMAKDVLFDSEKSTMGDVRVAYRAAETWKNITMILGVKNLSDVTEKEAERIQAIESKAIEMNRRLVDLSVKLIAQKFSSETKEIKADDLYNYLKGLPDVNWLTSQARDISTTGIPIVNLLAKAIQEANLKIDKEHGRNHGRIDEAYDKVKDHPEIKANGFSIFIKEQVNKFGEKVFGLVGRYSQGYYDSLKARRSLLNSGLEAAGNDLEKRKFSYDQYNEWTAKNTFMFNALPFLEEDKYTEQDRLKSVDELFALGFTRSEAADIVKESQKLYDRFLNAKEKYKISITVDIEKERIIVPDDKTREEHIDDLVERWDDQNSPIKFINQMLQPTLSANYAFQGTRYTVKVPRKVVDGKETGFYDANFSKISSDPLLYEFYTFFTNTINNSLGYLPEEEVDDLQSNFLPVITEKLVKEYGLTGLKDSIKGVGDWIMKTFTSVEYADKKTVDPVTGKVIYNLTPKFLNEKVPIEDRSKDLVVMVKMFTDMALVYKHKLQVQDYVDAVNEIVQNTQKTFKENEFGETIVETVAPKNLQAMVESEIKRSFYGAPVEKDLTLKAITFYNASELLTLGLYRSEKYKKAIQLEKEIKSINDELAKDDLTEKKREELEKLLYSKKMEHNNLGGRKFSATKLLDSNIKYSRMLALALQPFSALRNLVVGGLNNVIHAVGGRDFNWDDLKKATTIVKDSILKFWTKGTMITEDAAKLLKFMIDTGIVDGEDGLFKSGIINNKTSFDKIMEKLPNAYTLMKGGDFIFKSQTALAMAFNQKIKTEKGEFHIYEVMNNDLEFNEEKFGAYDPAINGNKDFEDVYNDFMLKVGQIGKKLHGLSTARTGVMGKDTIWGRLLFLFKSWLPETLANRYEKKKHDEMLGRDVEGYYRTFGRLLFKEQGLGSFKTLINAVFSDEVDENIDELQRENLRKFFTEMAALATMTIMYYALKAMAPDEDDDDRKAWNIILNQMYLLERDLSFYANITSFSDLTRQIVPSFTSIETLGTALKAAFIHYPAGQAGLEVDDDGEPLYDAERTLLKISKAIPVINNYNRILYYEKKLSDVR
jgi:hypothetical protein